MRLDDPSLLLFAIPLMVSLLFWLLSLSGLLHHGGEDADGGDVHAEGFWGHSLSLLGIGYAPLSVVLSLWFFLFGTLGILGRLLAGEAAGGGIFSLNALLFVPALGGSLLLTGYVSRKISPWFRDHGKASAAGDLSGKIALVRSAQIDERFGYAVLTHAGSDVQVSARLYPGASALPYGSKILLVEYRPEKNDYLAEAWQEDSDR